MVDDRKIIKTFQGQVVSDKMDKTVVVLVEYRIMHPLYKKYVSRYEKFKVEGLNEYIDDLIESEVFSRDINNLEELYVFLDILELKLQDKIAKRIGTFKIMQGRKEF